MTIPIFITARTNSTRLPRKHFLKLGPVSVIEHIVRRCHHFGFKPYLCVPSGQQDAFAEHTSCDDIFGGDAENITDRIMSCGLYHKLKKFHHLDGDDPFFNHLAITDNWHRADEYTELTPSPASMAGQASMGTTWNFNECKNLKGECLDFYNSPWPQRLTLDYEEDYHLLCAVNRMVGGYMAPRWAVDELFVKNPDLHKINWFRTEEWKVRQLAESGR